MNKPGTLQKNNDGYTITIAREYDHDINKVWNAITDPEKMSMWFTDVEWDFRPGGSITFIFQDEEETRMSGEIKTINPPLLLEYEWHNDEPPHEFARWELFEKGVNQTKLVLTYSKVIEDYAVGVSAGWHITLDDLGRLLNGETNFDPFGGGETEQGKKMKKVYEDVFKQTFGEMMETKPLIMERTYNAPVAKVWQALTDAEKMKQWYFDIKSFEPEVGYEFSFLSDCVTDTADAKGEEYLHLCKVTDVIPLQKLTYSWKYGGYEGMSYVTFELYPEGEGTRLVLTHTGLETFPPLKNFTRESFTGGWTYLVGESLKNYVE